MSGLGEVDAHIVAQEQLGLNICLEPHTVESLLPRMLSV